MVVEVPPKVPSTGLRLAPVPQRPCLPRQLVHERHVVPRGKSCESGSLPKVAFTDFVTNCVTADVSAPNWKSSGEDTSGPAIVVASVDDCERSVLDLDRVEGPGDIFR